MSPNKKQMLVNEQEKKLISRIVDADEQAFEQLYSQYFSRLYRFISRIMGARDIDEIINDVMYVVWQKAGSYNQNCRPSTWIFGIAYNKTIQSVKKASARSAQSIEELGEENILFASKDTGLKQLEMYDWLQSGFESLSPEQRAVVELTYFQGMKYVEIAEVMDCSENTIKTRMYHARIKLAPILLRLADDTAEKLNYSE